MLESAARLTCIENVPPAPIRADLVLDGTMFAGLRVVRKRHFELNFRTTIALGFPSYKLVSRHGWATPTDSDNSSHTQAARAKNGLPMRDSVAYRAIAMGTPWMMTRREIGEAIPPAYAEFIGREALRQMRLAP